MDKAIIIEAYIRGLLSTEECTKILGIDPNILLNNTTEDIKNVYNMEQYTR